MEINKLFAFLKGKTMIQKRNLLPLLFGDPEFATRLEARLATSEDIEFLDPRFLFESNFVPNFLVALGPLNESLQERAMELRKMYPSAKLGYLAALDAPEDEEREMGKAKELNADYIVVKEFVTFEDFKELARKACDV